MTVASTIDLYEFHGDEKEAEEYFLKALVELQRHYGLYVASGCDCCGGVYLSSTKPSAQRSYDRTQFLTGD